MIASEFIHEKNISFILEVWLRKKDCIDEQYKLKLKLDERKLAGGLLLILKQTKYSLYLWIHDEQVLQ